MRVVLYGATGMVGQGALRECLADGAVARVLTVGRKKTGRQHEKLVELEVPDLLDYSAVEKELAGYDACFFCLGVTSTGMTEEAYRRVTVDFAVAAARALVAQNPGMTFVYVSGTGSDATGKSRTMWARVKGEGENAILAMPFKGKYVLRPAFIRAGAGIVSRTTSYRILYAILRPFIPIVSALFPSSVTSTENMGRAMINLARRNGGSGTLDTPEINAAAKE